LTSSAIISEFLPFKCSIWDSFCKRW